MAVTWAQLRDEFHLAGTQYDHDQSTHGGGGGATRTAEIDRLVEQMGDWESSKPWNLTKDQAIAQTVPGFWHKSARGSETASWDGRYIRTTDDFYALPEETRRAVAYHEAGHALLEAAGGVTADDLDLLDKPGGQALGYNAEEILAEAYSALWSDPDWFDRMGADEIRQRVTEVAEAAGFPLPDRKRTDTFHLKGTQYDHDQSTHGGGVARVVDGVYDFTDFAGHGATYRDHETQQAAIAEFDALPDDALIALYHGTSQRLAKSIIETGRYIPGLRKESLDGVPLASFTPGIYVAPTYDDAANYGDTVVRIVAPKSALIPSKEAGLVNASGLGRAFMNTSAGAVLRPEIEFEATVVDRRRRELSVEFGYDPNQPRDDIGRWTDGPGADPADDYHGGHRPTDTGPRIHDLWESESTDGLDVYDNPQFYTGYPGPELAETIRQLRAVRGKPDAKVTIYRAAPRGAEIREGDWVSLSKRYARTHADSGNAGDDPVILELEVPAREVRWAIDDLMEYGWFPTKGDDHHRELAVRVAFFHAQHNQQDHGNRPGGMRIVRNKSIPNVSDDRLLGDLQKLHDRFHTPEGLHRFDGPRRNLIDNGRKIRLIVDELVKRGHHPPDCPHCAGTARTGTFHLAGTEYDHDQSTHGGGGGGPQAGDVVDHRISGWRRTVVVDDWRKRIGDAADELTEEDIRILDSTNRPDRLRYSKRIGDRTYRVEFWEARYEDVDGELWAPNVENIERAVRMVEDLGRRIPPPAQPNSDDNSVTVAFLRPTAGGLGGGGGMAWVGHGKIDIDSNLLRPDLTMEYNTHNAVQRPGVEYGVPSTTTELEYALTHEWGHLHDIGPNGDRPSTSLDPYRIYVSPYGRTSPAELFAEMFAAYHISPDTVSPDVRAYAEQMGWDDAPRR